MKRLLCIGLILTMSLAAVGCGKKEEEYVATPSAGESAEVEEEKEEATQEPEAEAEDAAEEAVTVDAKALAEALLNDIQYDDTLTEVDLETAQMFLNFADVEIEEGYIYESSGATAEEIVVIVCKDDANADSAKTTFEQRVEEQTENFTDYVPEEIPKLKDAVIKTSGQYAVLSVSKDAAKAKEIIEGALK